MNYTYEAFVQRDNTVEIWRRAKPWDGRYPEGINLHSGTWISDFGLGDYESDKAYSVRTVTGSYQDMPEKYRGYIDEANQRHADEQRKHIRLIAPKRLPKWKEFIKRVLGI